ncbi:MAG: hypothetical protein IH845_03945 [Nanoarchaeota archaeon]|nr:hypothetical protein [Nanoarchaeota archaeon]
MVNKSNVSLEETDWAFHGVSGIEASPCMYFSGENPTCGNYLVRHIGSRDPVEIQMTFEAARVYALNYNTFAVDTKSHTICYDCS